MREFPRVLSANLEDQMTQLDPKSFEQWQEKLWSTYVRLESQTDDSSFYGHVREAVPNSNALSFVHSTRQITERTNANIRSDPQEVVIFAVQASGYGFVEQGGRQARLEKGDFAIYETTRPYRLSFDKPFDQLVFLMPRALLERRLPNLSYQTARRFHGQTGAVALAAGFVFQLAKNAESLGTGGLETFTSSAADLIANAIQFETSGVDDADLLRFERLQARILRYIRSSIPDYKELAEMEGMSLRTLHRLFQIHGLTPGKWILDQRLEGVADDLRAATLKSRSITEIAFSWGFNDLSSFNRAFKAKFGHSPRALRSRAF
jgi:AraC-like DNA-binding protein